MGPNGHQKGTPRVRRRGVAAVEAAVSLPVLLLLVMGTIEATDMIFLTQTLTAAAHAGARAAVGAGTTATDVQNACQHLLDERTITGATVTINPADPGRVAPGSYITVAVAAPNAANSALCGWYFNSQTLTGQVTMMKEF